MDELLNTLVKFKNWLQQEETLGTPVLHGGIGETPGDDNHNMPVRSRFVTNNGAAPEDTTPDIKPERIFGFDRRDRRNSKKRKPAPIDNGRFPLSTGNPASIGFSRD